VAVVGVVLYHGGHLQGGFLGVDLFFVLSGFLITSLLIRDAGPDGSIGFKHFWSRRARRLLPALLLLLIVVPPVYAHWFAKPVDLNAVRQDGFASLFYVTNWSQILHGQSYFTATLVASPLRHLWSLAVEEQFYLVWPIVIAVAMRRGGPRTVLRVAALGAVISAGLTMVLGATHAVSLNSLYLATHTRAAALLAGAALAAWLVVNGPPKAELTQRRLQSAAMVAAVVLAVMWATLSVTDQALYVGGLALSAVAGTILVACAATARTGPLIEVLSLRPFRALGTISYGIYLWSWPITQMVSERHTPFRGWTLLLVQVILTVDLAAASWLLLERPILRGALPPPKSGRALALGVTAAAISVIASTAGAIAPPSTAVSTAGYSMSTVAGAPRLLVVGDSLPGRIAQEGIIPQRNLLGVSTVDRTVPGCILLRPLGRVKGIENNIRDDVRPCDQGWGKLVDRFRPDVVLMLFGEFPNDQVEIGGSFNLPCTPAYRREERAKLAKAFDELTSRGARVVISTAPGSSVSWVLDGVPKGMTERVDCMNRVYRDAARAHADVDVVDLASYICPDGHCKDAIDGVDLRQDTVHFRGPSAELVARWMIPKVLGTKAVAISPSSSTTAPGPPKPAFCKRWSSLSGSLSEVGRSGVGGADSPERKEIIRALRLALPPDLAAIAPDEIKPDAAKIASGWSALLDRAVSIPAHPTPSEIASVVGELVGPIDHVAKWYGPHCT
jgi:peptidoglycan/LPS O-acetylase OafA/YrhL